MTSIQHKTKTFFLALCLLVSGIAFSQDTTVRRQDTAISPQDTLRVRADTTKPMIPVDSLPKVAQKLSNVDRVDSIMRHHSPKKAAIRSAILPGWGQIYNRKYWKLPIVYGALGASAAVFSYNLKWYRWTRYAFKVAYTRDTANFGNVHPELQYFVQNGRTNDLQSYRNGFRRDIDYSAIIFILLWGLNVVDATVDAHLKPFDVSPDLSLKLKLGPSEMARTNGVSLVLAFK